jgi:16S rRNA (guanine1207-N2)-methyltransferase
MSLALPSQLLLQQDLIEQTLLINPPQDDLPHHAPKSWTVTALSHTVNKSYQKQGFALADICTAPTKRFPHVIIYMTKAKSRLALILDYARASLEKDGDIWIVGENKGGVKNLHKSLKDDFAQIDKMTSGKHSAIVTACGPVESKPFDINNYYSEQVNELGIPLKALPGVFSQEKLDKGTAMLLKHLPRKVKGRVLDFGCGAGIIGAYISQNREVEEVELLDDDILAVTSAQKNIKDNDIAFSEAYLSNGFENVEDRYHWIVSNPPFHQGVKTDYNVTEKFLNDAREHLKLSGKLLIVANEFLTYENILREHFNGVTQVAKENGYKLIQCEGIRRKPKP